MNDGRKQWILSQEFESRSLGKSVSVREYLKEVRTYEWEFYNYLGSLGVSTSEFYETVDILAAEL